MKQFYLFLIIGLFMFSSLISQTSKSGGILKYGEEQNPESYDPFSSFNNMASLRISQLIFEPLVKKDEYGNIKPLLATDWKILNKNKTIRFKIRKGVKWHDNFPFKPEDVKFTIQALLNPKTRAIQYYKLLAQKINSITVLENAVEIDLKKSVPDILLFFSNLPIYPKHIFKNNIIDSKIFFENKPIGTGPFMFKRGNENRYRLVKNPFYYNKVYLDGITCKVTLDPELGVQELLLTSTDLKVRIPNRDLGKLESAGDFKIYTYNSLSITAVAFNFKNELLTNEFLRKAMVLGLNRKKMLNTFYLGYGQLISGPFPPNSTANNPNVLPLKYSEYEAKLYLSNAGCIDSDGDRILEYNNKRLEFNLLVEVDKNSQTVIKIADAMQEYMRNIGIKINVVRLEWNSFLNRVIYNKKFDLALLKLNFDENVSISNLFYSKGSKNFISYKNPEIDQLFESAEQTTDNEKKRTIYYKLHRLLADDFPYIFLWTLSNNTAFNKKVRNVTIDPYKFFQEINRWYIDPELR